MRLDFGGMLLTFEGAGYTQRVFERGEETTPRALPESANSLLDRKRGGAREVDCITVSAKQFNLVTLG
jgi:hypothetical protein